MSPMLNFSSLPYGFIGKSGEAKCCFWPGPLLKVKKNSIYPIAAIR